MVEKRFNKLGMPDIERFENYLPTAFSSELTLLQKVNKIIQDLIRNFDLTNEMVDYLNNFIETFDENLYETVDDILNEWLKNDKLAKFIRDLINEEVIESRTDYLGKKYVDLKERLDSEKADVVEVTAQLAHKANETDLKVVQSQVGSLIANSTTTDGNSELIDGRIMNDGTVNKTLGDTLRAVQTVAKVGTNLLDMNRLKFGGYYDNAYGWNVANNKTSYVSDYYIPVKEGDAFYVHNDGVDAAVRRVYFLNSSLGFVSVQENTSKIVIPSGVSFIHFQVDPITYPHLQVQYGVPTKYQKFKYIIPKENVEYDFNELDTILSQCVCRSSNLFDSSKVIDNYIVNAQGKLSQNVTSDKYGVSDFIDVSGKSSIYVSSMTTLAFYDSKNVFISSIGAITVTTLDNIVSIPSGAYKIRFTIKGERSNVMVSDTKKPFEEYYLYSDKLKTFIASLNQGSGGYKRISNIISKIVDGGTYKIKLLGDSNTHGVGGTGFTNDGERIPGTDDSVKTSPNSHSWANSFRDYIQEKFPNTKVKNWGVSGWTSRNININLSSLIEDDDDIVIVMIGTNDRFEQTLLQYKTYLENILNYIVGKGKEVIFVSCIPASVTNESNPIYKYHLEDIDHAIMYVTAKYNREYIPIFKLFNEYCQSRNISLDSLLSDGLHMNDNGHDVMFYLLTNALGFGTKTKGATW